MNQDSPKPATVPTTPKASATAVEAKVAPEEIQNKVLNDHHTAAPSVVDPDAPKDVHDGRRYSVGRVIEKGKRKTRYVETNDLNKGCRFL